MIAVVVVVVALGVYIYRHHFMYIKRFVNINLAGYGMLHEDQDGDVNMFGKPVGTHFHDDENPHQSVSNPIFESSTMTGASNGRHVSIGSIGDDNLSKHSSPFSTPSQTPTPAHRKHGNSEYNIDDDEQESERIQNIAVANIVKAGYLMKQSTNKSWLKRYFFIKDNSLFYSKRAVDLNNTNGKPIPAVLVANLTISTIKESPSAMQTFEFEIISPGVRGIGTGGGSYVLQADDDHEYQDWVRTVRQCIENGLTSSAALNSSSSANATTTSSVSNSVSNNNNTHTNIQRDTFTSHPTPSSSLIEYINPSPKTLDKLCKHNPYCADCGAKNPDWVSLNLCIMMCIECSGVHRSLGSHISKVRSLKLDKWTKTMLQLLLTIGNEQSNKVWEAQLPSSCKPKSTDGNPVTKLFPKDANGREAFIRAKYVEKRYLLSTSSSMILNRKLTEYELLEATLKQDYLTMYKQIVLGVDVDCVVHNKDLPQAKAGGVSSYDVKLFDHSPLMIASIDGDLMSMELLLQWNVNIEVKNSKGFTALDYAEQSHPHSEVTELLTIAKNKK